MRLLAIALLVTAPHVAGAQAQDQIPVEVRRRIAQALWPENLFDSTGHPEPGSVWRELRSTYSELRIRRGAPVAELPGVTIYTGSVYPSDCTHCDTRRVAVAQRGSSYTSLLTPDHIRYVAGWAASEVLADTVRFQTLLLNVLRSTCLPACEIKRINSVADIPDGRAIFLHGVNGEMTKWQMPRSSAWQGDGHSSVEFAVFAGSSGVYAVRAEWVGGEHVRVHVTPVARNHH